MKKLFFFLAPLLLVLSGSVEETGPVTAANKPKMQIEIWSDVMCPFCYLGKRNFENALAQFPHRDQVEVVWKSFQLAPDIKTDTGISVSEFLAREKGIPLEKAKKMNHHVTQMGEQAGIEYNFDKAVVANSFNAHRLLQYAREKSRQTEMKERLFRAYFTEGRNIDDEAILCELGAEAGLDRDSVSLMLQNGSYGEAVKSDIEEARKLGIQGVPYFLINKKSNLYGAHESRECLKALEKAFEEWKRENP